MVSFALFCCLLDLGCCEGDVISLLFLVTLLMDQSVLLVACLTVFVNCLVQQFTMCLGVVAIFLLNVMDVFSARDSDLLDVPCMVFHKMCVLCL